MTTLLPQDSTQLKKRATFLTALILNAFLLSGEACSDDELERIPPIGHVDGYLCDPLSGGLATGTSVSGVGRTGAIEALTDESGYFVLKDLLIGVQTLRIEGEGFSDELVVTVQEGKTWRLPDPPCLILGTGGISGRVCATEGGLGSGVGYWVSGATVFIDYGEIRFETESAVDGTFSLANIPVGAHTLRVQKGSFYGSHPISVVADAVSALEPVCLDAEIALGVVGGLYDPIEEVLFELGFSPTECWPAEASWCPPDLESDGAVTLFEGSSSYYVTDLLMVPELLSEFDVLFFNCGLADGFLTSSPPDVVENLRNYVSQGGSLYVSDWAYEVLRTVFPERLEFFGGAEEPGAARVGAQSSGLVASVSQPGLADVLESENVSLVFNKGNWAMPAPNQPQDVLVWIAADEVSYYVGEAAGQAEDVPLLMSFSYGEGRVVFTTFHSHQQASDDMMAILRHMVFEL